MGGSDRRAVIVGAGIGGLATAIGLVRSGWRVQVYEQTEAPRPVGAGIALWSNARRALDWLQVAEALHGHGSMQLGGGVRTPSGRWLSRSDGARLATGEAAMLMVHRAQLHRQLLAALPPDTVTFAARVERLELGPDAAVLRATVAGKPVTVSAELLVGADGIHSVCRRQLWPAAPRPHYAGFTAWRGVTDGPVALADQSQTLGSAAEFGLTQLVDGRVYWFATGNDSEGGGTGDERAEVLRRFGGWHAPIREVVEATSPRAVLRHDIYRTPRPYPPFATGRAALVGDAAHAMVPNLGQGGCLALEDAVVLSWVLGTGGDIPSGLRRYDAARRPRTEKLARLSDLASRTAQTRNRALVVVRAAVLAVTPAKLGVAGIARAIDWQPPG